MTTTPKKLTPFDAETVRLRLLAAEAAKMVDECYRPQPAHPLHVLEAMGLSVTAFRRLVEELTGTVQAETPEALAKAKKGKPLEQLADENRQLATLALNIANHNPDNTDRATTARLWNALEPLALNLALANSALYRDQSDGHWGTISNVQAATEPALY